MNERKTDEGGRPYSSYEGINSRTPYLSAWWLTPNKISRSQIGLRIVLISIAILAAFFIGKAFGNQSRIVITQMPENQVCQPFRTEADQKAQEKELEELGAKPVMSQMLLKAFKDQSAGKIELIPVVDRFCQENLGSLRAVRTTTYYAVRKKI